MKEGSDKGRALGNERTAELRQSFNESDANRDGYIQYPEFVSMLDGLGAEMSSDEMKIGFDELDTDNDGLIDFGEFLSWWTEL